MKDYEYKGKRYIGMVRASHASDELSTDAQLKLLHDAVKNKAMVHVDDLVLDGMTGSLPGKRDDLHDLINRKKNNNDFDVLVLQRLDRLTRGGSDHGFWFQHECNRAGIHLLFVGDDIPQGKYANLIKVAKYEAAQEQAFSISQRSTQGSQLALEQGRNITSSHTPYGCWRLYLNSEGIPTHIIRDLGDGRQQKLHHQSHEVIDAYGKVGEGSRGHYRKQKTEKVLLIEGDKNKADKQSKSKHKASDYLLSGLLVAKQDGGPLVGVLCGRVGKTMRYYRHRRARRGYIKGSIFNNMFRADILENAILEIIRDLIKDTPGLRQQVLTCIEQQSTLMVQDETKLKELRKRREQIRKRTELIVSTLDDETLADARLEIDRLKFERRNLDQQIAAAEAAEQAKTIDPNEVADKVISQLMELPSNLQNMPKFALRQFLSNFIDTAVADMETKDVEFTLKLPAWAFAANNGDTAMRLVSNLRPQTGDETHQLFTVKLGFVDCRYIKLANDSCYQCKRRKAA